MHTIKNLKKKKKGQELWLITEQEDKNRIIKTNQFNRKKSEKIDKTNRIQITRDRLIHNLINNHIKCRLSKNHN